MVYSIGTGAVPTHSLTVTPAVETHSSHHHSSPSVPDFSHHHHHRHHGHSTIDFGTSFQEYPSGYYQADDSTPKSTDIESSDNDSCDWCAIICCILFLLTVVTVGVLIGTGVITVPDSSDDYDYWW